MEENNPKKKSGVFLLFIALVLIIGGGVLLYLSQNNTLEKKQTKAEPKYAAYKMTGNNLQKFDFYFMQLNDKEVNKVYSPLSIKYALEMLAEGANGETKTQLNGIIGSYVAKKYTNSKNMSFANALFIKDEMKGEILDTYTNTLKEKYNAEIVYDSFQGPDNLNKWVKDKTLNLISDLFDDSVKRQHFIITNALAIDMNWVHTIQSDTTDYREFAVSYKNEKYSKYIGTIYDEYSYGTLKFNNTMDAKTVEVGAAINKYDIVKTLGEENIRKTVTEAYEKWYKSEGKDCGASSDTKKVVDEYIKDINSNYKQVDTSTDFLFYDDTEVKAFAKDLRTYDGVTLQYVGIMPKTTALKDYVKNIDGNKVTTIINNLKEIKLENFKEGVVTEISAQIPLFKFDYTLDLKSNLQSLGVTDVFLQEKSDLRGIMRGNAFIDTASHKANIEFSNTGIKAAAATELGGLGDIAGCVFHHDYEVPVEKIDLTFDKPYLFVIRDKSTGEAWFTGTVYTPSAAVKEQ